jgi:predicted amidohydrolase YtcJ
MMDVQVYPLATEYEKVLGTKIRVGEYKNRLQFAGITLLQDGSLQERVAFLSQPYHKSRKGKIDNSTGQAAMSQHTLDSWIDQAFYQKLPVRVHCQGDACIDMMFEAVTKARSKYGNDNPVTLMEAQVIRPEQLQRLQELSIKSSFSIMDLFLQGIRYRTVLLGPERAERVVPLKEAQELNLRYSINSGTPAASASPISNLWVATTRNIREDKALGSEQRIDALSALKALTLDAAYQAGEESVKGSLKPGKLADLVILSENPLETEPEKIRDIQVMETIKEGKSIFKKQ